MASLIPFFLSFLARLRKKLTVIGMMGHTHGVNSATSPPSNPSRKMYHNERLPLPPSVPSMRWMSPTTGFHRASWSRAARAALSTGAPIAALSAAAACKAASESALALAAASASAFALSSSSLFLSVSPSTAGDLPAFFRLELEGGRHDWSLHAPYSRSTSIS